MAKKTELRKKIFDATIRLIMEKIKNAENEVKEVQQMANEYGPPKDRYDGYRMQLLRKRDILAEYLQERIQELETIKRLDIERKSNLAGLGAMVVTESQKLFIAIALGRIEIDGDKWHVISNSSPIAKSLLGLKKGDSIELLGRRCKILDVF